MKPTLFLTYFIIILLFNLFWLIRYTETYIDVILFKKEEIDTWFSILVYLFNIFGLISGIYYFWINFRNLFFNNFIRK